MGSAVRGAHIGAEQGAQAGDAIAADPSSLAYAGLVYSLEMTEDIALVAARAPVRIAQSLANQSFFVENDILSEDILCALVSYFVYTPPENRIRNCQVMPGHVLTLDAEMNFKDVAVYRYASTARDETCEEPRRKRQKNDGGAKTIL